MPNAQKADCTINCISQAFNKHSGIALGGVIYG